MDVGTLEGYRGAVTLLAAQAAQTAQTAQTAPRPPLESDALERAEVQP
jgi:hypothetical protein